MRQLNVTGFMHNRGRLIVASFLTKDLLINWTKGERYFSQKLVDIDRSQNVGNWNWSASYGLDSSPFLRILNPWSQSKTYDPKCEYIKKWIPELIDVKPEHIHKWDRYHKEYPDIDYPAPIVNHSERRLLFQKFMQKNFT
jgi:deoxyribodipyrimidine photo-lyase